MVRLTQVIFEAIVNGIGSEFLLRLSVFGILRLPIFMLICYATTLLEEPTSSNREPTSFDGCFRISYVQNHIVQIKMY